MSLALGIDVGTSGVRSAVLRGNTVLAMARADHPRQDPERIDAEGWWRAVETCVSTQIQGLREKNIDPADISAIAIDGTSGSMVLTDADLAPVSPALMYNSKGFIAEAERIDALVEGPHITKGANSALGRAMRLVDLATERPQHLMHQADFIAARLTGQGGHSDYNNALKTGFDPEAGSWPDWINELIDPAILPNVRGPGDAIAPIAQDLAERFGLSPEAMIHAGTTDSIAAFLASAPMEVGAAVTSLGSTLAVKLLSKTRVDDPAIGLYAHRLGDLWLLGGASNTGGAVLRSFFSDEELAQLSPRIDATKPLGLKYYPLSSPGERFPINDPDHLPRMEPRPLDDALFLQALFEGMADIEARCYAAIIAKGGSAPRTIFTAGGGAKNPVWTAIRAQALGQTPQIPEHSEAAIGAAKLAQRA